MRKYLNTQKGLFILVLIANFLFAINTNAQEKCEEISNKKAKKLYQEAVDAFKTKQYPVSNKLLKDAIEIEPEYADAYFLLGLNCIKRKDPNFTAAEKHFLKVVEICPEYDPYVYYYLGDIYFNAEKYDLAAENLAKFIKDPDKVKSDMEYSRAEKMQSYAKFYDGITKAKVPFEPKVVKGISSLEDEYLAIISPDNEVAFFTRKMKIPVSKNSRPGEDEKFKEKFMFSIRGKNGEFDKGSALSVPFNEGDNEGGPTLTIDNKYLYFTANRWEDVMVGKKKSSYYNGDIWYSVFENDSWSPLLNMGPKVNNPNTWESQPTISSDGKTLYFVSDRPGGYGGYDIYKTTKDANGEWGMAKNLGPEINTPGNEKSPFIHTDSQTLYFCSADYRDEEKDTTYLGHMGLGGYDIFFSKMQTNGKWSKPKNLGYPINTQADELSFFVSTDGKLGYFSSNKLNDVGVGGWDLFSFELYPDARPERVLLLTGEIKDQKTNEPVRAKVELKNALTKQITEIPIDSVTGKYAIAVLFKNDYIMTVQKDGYAYDSKYFAKNDTAVEKPAKVNFEVKPIEIGAAYKLNDIKFATNSAELNDDSKTVIKEFMKFLTENPKISVSINGHTDDVGNDESNMKLSDDRAKSVYDFLIASGIKAPRLKYHGYGETQPIETNKTEAGRAMNRRTEFVITGK
ncbi:MAG: OmpA family protein [Bacteroidetes bacterium]|nr:OmpA family protein [Bacteroidota bacterium]